MKHIKNEIKLHDWNVGCLDKVEAFIEASILEVAVELTQILMEEDGTQVRFPEDPTDPLEMHLTLRTGDDPGTCPVYSFSLSCAVDDYICTYDGDIEKANALSGALISLAERIKDNCA